MNNFSIRLKVLLVVLLPLFGTILLLSFMFIREHLTDLEVAFETKGEALSSALASALEYAAISGNLNQFNTISRKLLTDAEIRSIQLHSSDGQIQFTSSRSGSRSGNRPDSPDETKDIRVFRAAIYSSVLPIDDFGPTESGIDPLPDRGAGQEPLAWVTVSLSREQARQRQAAIIRNDILLTTLAMLLASFFAIYLASTVSNPILRLTRALSRIRDGDLNVRVPADSGGELSLLEQSINEMAEALQDARTQAREYAENTLYIEQVKAKTTLEAITEGVITTDSLGRITYLNPAAEELLEVSRSEAYGQQLQHIYQIYSPDTHRPLEMPVAECLQKGRSIRHEAVLLKKTDQSEHIVRDTATPIFGKDGAINGMVLVFHDFSRVKILSEKLMYQATHDELTGLLNRRAFESHLETLLEQDVENGTDHHPGHHAVCYIDLDHFKAVNDSCGHAAGDALLKRVSREIRDQVRAHDLLARLGGDEFGIVLQDCPPDKSLEIANLVCHTIKQIEFEWQGQAFHIGASIGLISFGDKPCSLSDILISADTACYAAKDEGRGRVHVLAPVTSPIPHKTGEMKWLHTLNECIQEDRFELYCQEIRPMANRHESSSRYEVLVRLQDPDNQHLVSPRSFLETAERYHLMPEIDRRVIRRILARLRKPPASGQPDIQFHINLSGQSLGDHRILELLQQELTTTPRLAEGIVFEISEPALLANLNAARSFIDTLHKAGCQFVLDDFGKGLGSFAILEELETAFLKIDAQYIRDIGNNPLNQSIVEALCRISQTLNIKTIAACVETDAILQELERYPLDYVQGFAIREPQPLSGLTDW